MYLNYGALAEPDSAPVEAVYADVSSAHVCPSEALNLPLDLQVEEEGFTVEGKQREREGEGERAVGVVVVVVVAAAVLV